MKEEPMIPFDWRLRIACSWRIVLYQCSSCGYTLTGGANGLTEYYAVNYSLKDKKFLNSEGILNYDRSAEIDKQIQRNFKNPENCFSEVPTLANVTR